MSCHKTISQVTNKQKPSKIATSTEVVIPRMRIKDMVQFQSLIEQLDNKKQKKLECEAETSSLIADSLILYENQKKKYGAENPLRIKEKAASIKCSHPTIIYLSRKNIWKCASCKKYFNKYPR